MSPILVISDMTYFILTSYVRSTASNTLFGISKNYDNDGFFFSEAALSVLLSTLTILLLL